MKEHLQTILKEMCKRVDADFESIDFRKDNWYWEYTWTQDQENSFSEWLFEYLMHNKKAREEIMTNPCKDKMRIHDAVMWFLVAYGWKVKK